MFQQILNNVQTRVAAARKPYQDAFRSYVGVQREAWSVVFSGSRSLARTELGAARDLFAAARANFDAARRDGVRRVATKPQAYVPGEQVISAYRDAIKQILKTGSDLTDVFAQGYKDVLGKLNGAAAKPAAKKAQSKKAQSKTSTGANSAQAKRPAQRKTAARRASAQSATQANTQASTKTNTKANTQANAAPSGSA